MSTIESTSWYFLETVGVENIHHFSGAVQKINHELAKITISNPKLEDVDGSGSDRKAIKKDILYALEIQYGSSSESDDSNDKDSPQSSDSEDKNEKVIQFGGQRMCGRHHSIYRRNRGYHKKHKRFDNYRKESSSSERSFERRCFNFGKNRCQLSTCPEPKDQQRIETNLTEWRQLMRVKKPLREINLADVNASAYTIHQSLSAEIFFKAYEQQRRER